MGHSRLRDLLSRITGKEIDDVSQVTVALGGIVHGILMAKLDNTRDFIHDRRGVTHGWMLALVSGDSNKVGKAMKKLQAKIEDLNSNNMQDNHILNALTSSTFDMHSLLCQCYNQGREFDVRVLQADFPIYSDIGSGRLDPISTSKGDFNRDISGNVTNYDLCGVNYYLPYLDGMPRGSADGKSITFYNMKGNVSFTITSAKLSVSDEVNVFDHARTDKIRCHTLAISYHANKRDNGSLLVKRLTTCSSQCRIGLDTGEKFFFLIMAGPMKRNVYSSRVGPDVRNLVIKFYSSLDDLFSAICKMLFEWLLTYVSSLKGYVTGKRLRVSPVLDATALNLKSLLGELTSDQSILAGLLDSTRVSLETRTLTSNKTVMYMVKSAMLGKLCSYLCGSVGETEALVSTIHDHLVGNGTSHSYFRVVDYFDSICDDLARKSLNKLSTSSPVQEYLVTDVLAVISRSLDFTQGVASDVIEYLASISNDSEVMDIEAMINAQDMRIVDGLLSPHDIKLTMGNVPSVHHREVVSGQLGLMLVQPSDSIINAKSNSETKLFRRINLSDDMRGILAMEAAYSMGWRESTTNPNTGVITATGTRLNSAHLSEDPSTGLNLKRLLSASYSPNSLKDMLKTLPKHIELRHDAEHYYVLVDHERKRIYLIVRGTKSIDDWMTDIAIVRRTLYGLKTESLTRVQEVQQIIHNLYAVYGDSYSLVIAGHSLGGYVASRVNGMFTDHIKYTVNKLSLGEKIGDTEVSIRLRGDLPSFLSLFSKGTVNTLDSSSWFKNFIFNHKYQNLPIEIYV